MEVTRSIYVAGPFSGEELANTLAALEAGERLEAIGCDAFVPHIFYWWNREYPKTYEHWLKKCLLWMRKCDAVYRLPGESRGADCEVAVASIYDIPVFRSEEEVRSWLTK
jgi:hypothetical protein